MAHDEEIARLTQAAAADPTLTVRLCDMLVAAGRADEAVTVCRRGLRDRPEDVDLRLALGRALSATGNLEEAQAALMDAVARKRRVSQLNIPITPPRSTTAEPQRLSRSGSGVTPAPQGPAVARSASGLTPHPTSASAAGGERGEPQTPGPRPLSSGVPLPVQSAGTARSTTSGIRMPPFGHQQPMPAVTVSRPPVTSGSPLPAPPLAPPPGSRSKTGPMTPVPTPMPVIGTSRYSVPGRPQHSGLRGATPAPEPLGPAPHPGAGAPLAQVATEYTNRYMTPRPATSNAPIQRPVAADLDVPDEQPRLTLLPELLGAIAELPEVRAAATERQPPSPPPAAPAPSSASRSRPSTQLEALLLAPDPELPLPPRARWVPAEPQSYSAAPEPLPPPPRAATPQPSGLEADAAPLAAAARAALAAPPAETSTTIASSTARMTPGAVPIVAASGAPSFDLDRIAANLRLPPGMEFGPQAPAQLQIGERLRHQFDLRRARTFQLLWICLALIGLGVAGGWAIRAATTASTLRGLLAQAAQLSATARYPDAVAARDLYLQGARLAPRDRRVAALAAEAEGRLAADFGEERADSAFILLRRAEGQKPGRETAATRAALRRAAALIPLARGEACPLLSEGERARAEQEDGDVAARCALQRGDGAAAWRSLDSGTGSVAALLERGSLALSRGDLEEADHAYRSVLDRDRSLPHPRALLGRALVAAERGQDPRPFLPQSQDLGPRDSAVFALVSALADARLQTPAGEAQSAAALDRAQAGWDHDARLALWVGRARLLQGRVSDAEAGVRAAQKRAQGDPQLLALDAEVALAKGYTSRVLGALAPLAQRPDASGRILSVLGRAQYQAGDARAAVETLTRALRALPGDLISQSYLQLSRAHLGASPAGQPPSPAYKEALAELTRLAQGAFLPVTTPRYALALLAFERKDLARAASEAAQALVRNPEAAQARTLLGQVLREQGKLAEALALLRQATSEAPALTAAQQALARLYLELDRPDAARQQLQRLSGAGKLGQPELLLLAQSTVALGLADEATPLLAAARPADGKPPSATWTRVDLELQSLRSPAAARTAAPRLDQERRAAPRDTALALQAGRVALRAGDGATALAAFESVKTRVPVPALLGIGRAQLKGRALPEAEAAFRAALTWLAKAPKDEPLRPLYGAAEQVAARTGLCRALLPQVKERKVPAAQALEAVAPVEAEVSQGPLATQAAAEGLACLAGLQELSGDIPRALATAERAFTLAPSNVDACIRSANELNNTKQVAGARARYQHCLTLPVPPEQAAFVQKALSALAPPAAAPAPAAPPAR